MLILDEATSSIDTRNELQVQEAFDKLMLGQNEFRRCPPSVHDPQCFADPRHERRKDYRAGTP